MRYLIHRAYKAMFEQSELYRKNKSFFLIGYGYF